MGYAERTEADMGGSCTRGQHEAAEGVGGFAVGGQADVERLGTSGLCRHLGSTL